MICLRSSYIYIYPKGKPPAAGSPLDWQPGKSNHRCRQFHVLYHVGSIFTHFGSTGAPFWRSVSGFGTSFAVLGGQWGPRVDFGRILDAIWYPFGAYFGVIGTIEADFKGA